MVLARGSPVAKRTGRVFATAGRARLEKPFFVKVPARDSLQAGPNESTWVVEGFASVVTQTVREVIEGVALSRRCLFLVAAPTRAFKI
jgi:hypothetical protein